MDAKFIHAVQNSSEVSDMLRVLRDATDLDRTHPTRQAVISDLSLLWAAVADAVGPNPGERHHSQIKVLDIARKGSASCVVASRKGGAEALNECAAHLTSFIRASVI